MIDEKRLIEELKEYKIDNISINEKNIVEIIEAQPKVGEWIPCSERLPKETGDYLVTGQWKGQQRETWVCEFLVLNSAFGGGWCNHVKNPVIDAWMPLPAPYKEEMRKKVE